MSHTVTIKMIADQEIELNGEFVNIHNIKVIVVDSWGRITDFSRHDKESYIENECSMKSECDLLIIGACSESYRVSGNCPSNYQITQNKKE